MDFGSAKVLQYHLGHIAAFHVVGMSNLPHHFQKYGLTLLHLLHHTDGSERETPWCSRKIPSLRQAEMGMHYTGA